MDIHPVIHLSTLPQALANARLAQAHGCAGVFLIHMDGRDELIPDVARAIRDALPTLPIGANFLSLPADFALERSLELGLDATWADAPGVRGDGVSAMAEDLGQRLRQAPGHTFFGSVAFKYQPVDPNPAGAAVAALALGMVPTTSGVATGQAPSLEKLAGIRLAIGPQARLAVASGVDAGNVAAIDKDKLAALVREARS